MIFRLFLSVILVLISEITCQDFSVYKNLLDEGNMEEIQKSLPYLNSQYPDNPFISYLNAAINRNGEEAIEQYKMIIEEYPGSAASELAIMKIGEYLYSQGLYTQASEQLKILPLNYPDSKDIERAVKLIKKSYLATGELDSIDHYLKLFRERYPQLNFDNFDYYSSVIERKDKPFIEEKSFELIKPEETESIAEQVKPIEKPWVIQVGAFKEKKNTEVMINRLKSSGYEVEVIENPNNKQLFLVQIVRFSTIEEAIIAGEDIKDTFGLEFRILERN